MGVISRSPHWRAYFCLVSDETFGALIEDQVHTGLAAGESRIRTISPSYKGVVSRRNCRDDAAIRCTGDARFRGPVKAHGLALLSPCGPSLSVGVGFALDAFFV